MAKPQKPQKKSTGTYGALAVLLGVIVLIVFAIIPAYQDRLSPQKSGPQTLATLDPTIIANLTAIPEMQPPSGPAADQLHALQAKVDTCVDYSEARMRQMDQHIAWLLAPSTIPAEILIAGGTNPLGKIVFGMAVYTSSEWRLRDRPTGSCLIPIGRTLNEMLAAAGETPMTIYDE